MKNAIDVARVEVNKISVRKGFRDVGTDYMEA